MSWIRNKVLHAYYHSAIDDKYLLTLTVSPIIVVVVAVNVVLCISLLAVNTASSVLLLLFFIRFLIHNYLWLLHCVFLSLYFCGCGDNIFRILVERILNTSLVPFSLDTVGRMKRLYTLYANLDEHAVK